MQLFRPKHPAPLGSVLVYYQLGVLWIYDAMRRQRKEKPLA